MKLYDVNRLLFDKFGLCGCSEIEEVLMVIKVVLEWAVKDMETRPNYATLFPDYLGNFYVIAGILTFDDFLEHGVSIRYSWITDKGKKLLAILENHTGEQIYNSKFDGPIQ